jgi:hypothetical protein
LSPGKKAECIISVCKTQQCFSETSLCSISVLQLKIFLLDAHQLLMLSVGTMMYLKIVYFAIFYNNCGTIHVLDINYIHYRFIYTFSSLSHLHIALTYVLSFKLHKFPHVVSGSLDLFWDVFFPLQPSSLNVIILLFHIY